MRLPLLRELYSQPTPARAAIASSRAGLWTGLVTLVRIWLRRHRERRDFGHELHAMPDETLADFGLTRSLAEAELAKPFWKS
ncbi:DUF1127 domain-containing protein [Bosea sp. BK604]|uniref:DUF1127 domain-containing protein n=1 Tax=Bosea sp. BK604 TaxID=2512180 RepID=UPI00140524E7|nr:DUF1127 domain-containing protein [Bosea sp. BK604]